ncbi:hypothetical protein L7F22_044482 [Adiantum nelumboides]|nr:hypothetical protein [Adiantum nelumboides]
MLFNQKQCKLLLQHEDRQVMAMISRNCLPCGQENASSTSRKASKIESLLKGVLEKQDQLQRQLSNMQQEQEFYGHLNLTRPLAVVSLMASLLKLLNNVFLRKAYHRDDVKEMKLVFPKEEDISYFKSWWFLYHETMEVPGLSLQEFWSQSNQLGYTGQKGTVASKKNRRVGTPRARLCAEKLNRVMVEAEEECISFVGPGMTADMLRKVVGFYISVLRMDKNSGTHLLENLLVVMRTKGEQQVKYQRPTANDPFKYVNREMVITNDDNVREKGAMVLTEIMSNIDKLGQLSCISPAVKWFGEWLLSSIGSNEGDVEQEVLAEKLVEEKDSSWEWCPQLNCELRHQNGLSLDKEGRQWTWYDNKWLLWSEEIGGWCSWEVDRWRKQF